METFNATVNPRRPASAIGTHEDEIFSKVTRRLIPFLFICYVFAYLDRINVGIASLQMKQDIGLSDAVYGLGAGIFFLGYVLFEVPSNLLLVKIGAKLTFIRIMVAWGITSSLMFFVQTATHFYILRFLLGVFEAGFFPGVVLYLTYWYPSARRGKIIALFMSAIAVSGIIGGPLSGWIMTATHGAHGVSGWQWMFLIEGIPSVVLGLLVPRFVFDRPSEANWLTSQEKESLERILAQDRAATAGDRSGFGAALKDARLWVLAFVYFAIAAGVYVLTFWLPQIIKGLGVSDPLHIGLLTAIPFLACAFGMVLIGRHSDRHGERRWHVAICMLIGAAALVTSTFTGGSLPIALAALTVATVCIISTMPIFWTIPAAYLSGTAAAGGIAMINSIGLIGGFVSPTIIGWIKTTSGSLTNGLYVFAGVLVVGAVVLLLGVPRRALDHP